MIRLLYNLLLPLGLLFFLPGYIMKMRRRGNYRRNFGQRFAHYDPALRKSLRGARRTWLHAVSVGEVAIALKLAKKLRELDATFRCVLTTTTTTGFAIAESDAPPWMEVIYNPLDFWPIMRRAFTVLQPERIILVEAEVWPNLAAAAWARRIPLCLVNARLSPRSERRFRKFRRFVAPTFGCLDLVCVQERADVERWAAIGVRREVIRHVGSIKYDPAAAATEPLAGELLESLGLNQRRILLGGSTHPGEEEVLARAFLELRKEFPDLLLIVAPRHVERTGQVRAGLEASGLHATLRTEMAKTLPGAIDCLIIDTTGELRSWYTVATVVFIGKSLHAQGGQNPVEPILAGKPVIFGPHMENFAALARALVEQHGAIQIDDAAWLPGAIAKLLRDETQRARLTANALDVLDPHGGATQRTAELVLACKSLAPA